MAFENPAGSSRASTDRYVRSLLELLGQRDPLVTMPEMPITVERLVADLDDAQLRRPEKPGKWCVIEVVQHLADTEIVYGYRVRKILADPGTAIAGYDQDAWARTLRYGAADLQIALTQLRTLRTSNLTLLGSLSPAEWERAGLHSERGIESVHQVVRLVAGHDFVHLNQIARIKTAIGA